MLIDYLAGSRDPSPWSTVRLRLEGTWPELTGSERLPRKGGGDTRIPAGIRRDEALRMFENSVNQPGTMFSTDHWLQPKLEQLRTLLNDPITQEQPMALLDVLYERHRMGDLLAWLQGPPMRWQSFFTLGELVNHGPQWGQTRRRRAEHDGQLIHTNRRGRLRTIDERLCAESTLVFHIPHASSHVRPECRDLYGSSMRSLSCDKNDQDTLTALVSNP